MAISEDFVQIRNRSVQESDFPLLRNTGLIAFANDAFDSYLLDNPSIPDSPQARNSYFLTLSRYVDDLGAATNNYDRIKNSMDEKGLTGTNILLEQGDDYLDDYGFEDGLPESLYCASIADQGITSLDHGENSNIKRLIGEEALDIHQQSQRIFDSEGWEFHSPDIRPEAKALHLSQVVKRLSTISFILSKETQRTGSITPASAANAEKELRYIKNLELAGDSGFRTKIDTITKTIGKRLEKAPVCERDKIAILPRLHRD